MQATVIECIVDMFKIAHESNSQLKLTVRKERNDFIVYIAQLESSAANASLTRMMNFYNRVSPQKFFIFKIFFSSVKRTSYDFEQFI